MSDFVRLQGSRGISNIVAGLIIISATLVAGTVAYMTFLRKTDVREGGAKVRIRELQVVRTGGRAMVSATLKNTGSIPLENIRVEVVCSEENRAVLTIDNLSPKHTGGDFKAGNWGFRIGKTYPVAVTARFENEVVLSRATKVTVQ